MVRKLAFLLVALTMSLAGMAVAHEGHTHKLLGTVAAVHAEMKHVEVTLPDGTTSGFYVNEATKYVQGTAAASSADLKAGVRVVVEGTMDKDKLTATKVQLGTSAPRGKAAVKTPSQH